MEGMIDLIGYEREQFIRKIICGKEYSTVFELNWHMPDISDILIWIDISATVRAKNKTSSITFVFNVHDHVSTYNLQSVNIYQTDTVLKKIANIDIPYNDDVNFMDEVVVFLKSHDTIKLNLIHI